MVKNKAYLEKMSRNPLNGNVEYKAYEVNLKKDQAEKYNVFSNDSYIYSNKKKLSSNFLDDSKKKEYSEKIENLNNKNFSIYKNKEEGTPTTRRKKIQKNVSSFENEL